MKDISVPFYLAGRSPEKWNAFINYFNHQAQLYADQVYIRYWIEENGGFSSSTYSQINHISTHLACKWSGFTKNTETAALLFDHSRELLISMLAIFKLRIPVLVLSPRNSKAAISNLLSTTRCGLLIPSGKYKQVAEDAAKAIKGCRVESFSEYDLNHLEQQPIDLSVLDDGFNDQDLDKISLILHSSGTTGFPKPVYITNRNFLNRFEPFQHIIESGKPMDSGPDVYFAGFPIFHSFGLVTFYSLLYNGSSTVFPKRLPPSQQDIEFALKTNHCNIMSIPPITTSEMVGFNRGKNISHLQSLRSIITAGAEIPINVGNWYHSNNIKLCYCYGLTESPLTMANDCDPSKEFSPAVSPCRFDRNGEPYCHFEDYDTNVKHLCLRGDLPSLARVKLRGDGFYETGDLFTESSRGYHYVGRKDDTIIMSNGEKTNPVPMEQIINTCSVIKQSIVVGRGRQCTALLILINDDSQKMNESDRMKPIMDAVKRANDISPSHSAIVRQMISILPSYTVLPLTPKGTLKRREVEEMFGEILDRLYDDFYEDQKRSTKKPKLTSCSKQDLVQFLCQGAAEILNLRSEDIQVDRSLFDLGLNSLKSNQLRNYMSSRFDVDTNFIYHHPSISSICNGLMDTRHDLIEISYDQTQHLSEIYLDKAEKEFSRATLPLENRSSAPSVVLLTGATGSLGAFILCQLLKDINVKKVYCVIRGDPQQMWSRLQKSFCDRSLDVSLLSERVEVIALNFMDATFGLDRPQFEKLREEITMVQHCGWLLNFNLPIEHFDKECIAPFYNMLKFSLERKDPIPVHFVSSVSASAFMDPMKIQEVSPPIDARVALPMGYGQSKFVVEVVMDFLATKKQLPCFIHRVGQMYGDTVNGVWNYSEQFPLMFIGGGSIMGVMPALDRSVNWLPIDCAAKIIVEIMLKKQETRKHIYHIVNPHVLQWVDVLDIFKSSGVDFTTVSLSKWINLLEKSPENPANALISHYKAMLKGTDRMTVWETVKTASVAPTINHIPPLDRHLFKKFLEYWSSVKSFSTSSSQ